MKSFTAIFVELGKCWPRLMNIGRSIVVYNAWDSVLILLMIKNRVSCHVKPELAEIIGRNFADC